MRCAMSATGSARCGGSTFRKRTGSFARSACQHGRISWSARWCACFLRRTTSRSSPAFLMVSVPDGDAIPHCGTWLKPGLGQPGLSKGTFPTVSGASTTELWSILSRRRSTITGSSGLCGTCFRPDTWKTGFGARRSAGHRKAALFPRILSNVYLHKLDYFVERILIPHYTRGERRASNPAYQRIASAIERARKHGDREKVRELSKRQRLLPSLDPEDPGYRRLRYVRYADDHLLGFTGPKSEAEKIKARLARFLREDLKLELNQEKTLITHASTGAAKFLGYEITVQKSNTKVTRGRRSVNGSVRLRVPRAVIKEKCALYCKRGEPAPRNPLVNKSDLDIVATYGSEYRGIVQF